MHELISEFIEHWGYYGVFLSILATGFGFPVPEELPILAGGAMVTHGQVQGWKMLPLCILGVILGDSVLYFIGRFWGAKLVKLPLLRKVLTPERFANIAANFNKYGVRILLFARLTPGIRTPIFLTAGITKLPFVHFLIADAIYAVPGVTILFFLGYWFTDSIIDMVKEEPVYLRPAIVLVVLAGVGLYIAYRFWRRPVITGNPTEMPPLVGEATIKLEEVAESVADKVMHLGSHPDMKVPEPPSNPSDNGALHPPSEEKTPSKTDDKMAG